MFHTSKWNNAFMCYNTFVHSEHKALTITGKMTDLLRNIFSLP